MAVKCGYASIDERGKVSGGKPGDQTGREVLVSNWYNFGQTAVYRWKDRNKAKAFAQCIESLCNNSADGYNQTKRTTLNSELKKLKWDYKKLKTPCETDCSGLVVAGVNCVAKKELLSPKLFTGNIGAALLKTGWFDKLTASKYLTQDAYLMTGDIINKPYSHVIVALANGSKAVQTTPKPAPNKPATKVKFTYQVRAGGKKYSTGKRGKAITDIAIKVNKGALKYRVHVKGGKWLPYVTGYSWKNAVNGYAGNGKPIDAVQVILTGVNAVATYRVSPINKNFYPYQKNAQTKNGQDGYAGSFGVAIDRFEIK